MRKKTLIFMLVLALAVMAFAPMAMAATIAPEQVQNCVVIHTQDDFMVLPYAAFDAIRPYLPVADFSMIAGPGCEFYFVDAEMFPGVKMVVNRLLYLYNLGLLPIIE